MIEEFSEWLERLGIDEGLADEMHQAAYENDEEGLRDLAADDLNDDRGLVGSELMVQLYHQWQRDAGERDDEAMAVDRR